MEVVRIREKKWVLWVGIIGTIVLNGALAYVVWNGMLQTLYEQYDRVVVGLISLDVVCMLLLAFYCRRKVIVYPGYISYTPLVGRKRVTSFREITEVVAVEKRYFVIDVNGKRVAFYEKSMTGWDEAHKYFCSRGIPVAGCSYPVMPKAEEEFSQPKEQWDSQMPKTWKDFIQLPSEKKIARQKKSTKVIRIVTAVLCVVLYVLHLTMGLNLRLVLGIFVGVLFFYLGMYLGRYPNMIWSKESACDEYHIAFPYVQCFLIVICMAKHLDTIKFMNAMWMIPAGCVAVFIISVYFVIVKVRRVKDHILKRIGVVAIVIFLSFVSAGTMLYVVGGKEKERVQVELLHKEMHRSRRSTSRYFTIEWNGIQSIQVNKELYANVNVGDSVTVCIEETLFGIKYWSLQQE